MTAPDAILDWYHDISHELGENDSGQIVLGEGENLQGGAAGWEWKSAGQGKKSNKPTDLKIRQSA